MIGANVLQCSDVRVESKLDMRKRSSDVCSYSNVRHWPAFCYRCELGASAWHKAANLGVAVTVVIGPHDGWAEPVGFGYNCRVRHHNPFSLNSYTILALL